ncbi:MAG: class I SAM-dependent methyltransferase [Bryobacteraceae bacterium]
MLLKRLVHAIGGVYLQELQVQEKPAPRLNERPIEYEFVFRAVAEYCPKTMMDVGTGQSALPALVQTCGVHVFAIDHHTDYWKVRPRNIHFNVVPDDIRRPRTNGHYDMITCVSVLEHIKEDEQAVCSMVSKLNPGGHLILTFPYSERLSHSNVYTIAGSYGANVKSYVTRQYCRADLDLWMRLAGAEIVEQEYWRLFDSEYWSVGNLVRPAQRVGANDRHQLTCLLIRQAQAQL